MNNLNKEFIDNFCIIDGKAYKLEDVEKMGIDEFSKSAHIFPSKSLFKYYPNVRKYVKEEKKYRNYSFEALTNNTVFLQNANNFDDCFDCAIDLDYNKFLYNRVHKYCEYFDIEITDNQNFNQAIYLLSNKFYEYGTPEVTIANAKTFDDKLRNLYIEVFVNKVFAELIDKKDWNLAIFSAINSEYTDFCETLSKFKIACFTTSPYLNRMWSSAYADNNKGFCIEYEINLESKENIDIYNYILPVIYSQKRNDLIQLSLNVDATPTKDDLWQIYYNGLLRKSIHWVDQNEWRLILPDGFINRNPMPFFKIKKIYLGNKMSKKERLKIIKYCKAHSIEYVGMVRKLNSFDLVECSSDCYTCKIDSNHKS